MNELLRQYREKADISQEKLAAQIGVRRETVARWEAGDNIGRDYLAKVSEVTGIPRVKLRPDLARDLARLLDTEIAP